MGEDLFRLHILGHDDELRLSALDEFRDLVRALSDLPALLGEFNRLIGLVDQILRHLEADVHRFGHCGDLLPPRGRGTSSVIGSPFSREAAVEMARLIKGFG